MTKEYAPWSYAFGFNSTNQMNKIEHRGKCINDYYENGEIFFLIILMNISISML